MSNKKFYFEFKKRIPKIQDFFPSHSKKKLQLLLIFKFYLFYLFEKKKNLNYNRWKLLAFTKKKKRKENRRVSKYVQHTCYIYIGVTCAETFVGQHEILPCDAFLEIHLIYLGFHPNRVYIYIKVFVSAIISSK